MDDPRWQRAMEQLGLNMERHWCPDVNCPVTEHHEILCPDPSDPATFLRVVEAVLKKGVRIMLEGDVVELTKDTFMLEGDDPETEIAVRKPTFYQAVMEAFGGDDAEQK